VVVLDNLPAHNNAAAETRVRAKDAWFLSVLSCSHDLKSTKMKLLNIEANLRA
jgi:hypothetical protein